MSKREKYNHQVNKNFKHLRKRFRLTQEQFAILAGVTRYSIGAYEEQRALVPMTVIKTLVDKGLVPKKRLYDFLFNKTFNNL